MNVAMARHGNLIENMELSATRLRAVLKYDPESGLFIRKIALSRNVRVGSVAGCPDKEGYIVMNVDRRTYKAHRLAWLYQTGTWPDGKIDHINGHKDDNRFSNLRVVNDSQNGQNRKAPANNTTGFKGVCLHQGRWQAQIVVRGKKLYLGMFSTPEAAYAAYVAAAKEHHGEYAPFY